MLFFDLVNMFYIAQYRVREMFHDTRISFMCSITVYKRCRRYIVLPLSGYTPPWYADAFFEECNCLADRIEQLGIVSYIRHYRVFKWFFMLFLNGSTKGPTGEVRT